MSDQSGLDTNGCLTCPDNQMGGWGRGVLIDTCPKGRYIPQVYPFITCHLPDRADKMFGGQVKFAVHLPEGQVGKNVNVEPCIEVAILDFNITGVKNIIGHFPDFYQNSQAYQD